MKRLFAIFLVSVYMTMFISCDKKPGQDTRSETNGSSQAYFIFPSNNILSKINCDTAVFTPLCQDPLCKHDDKCPFHLSDENSYTVTNSGRYIYFFSRIGVFKDRNEIYYICRYDISEGNLIKIDETGNTVYTMVAYNEDLYYTQAVYEKNEDKDIKTFSNIYKVTGDNKPVKLNNQKVEGILNIFKITDDRIYYDNSETGEKTNSSLDYTDIKKTEDIISQWNYDYKFIRDKNSGYLTIESVTNSEGKRTIITDKAGLCFYIGEYIYYFNNRDKPKFIIEEKETGRKYYSGTENKIYRSKYDGTENGEFCDFGDNYYPHFPQSPNYRVVVGDYCLIRFTEYGYDKYNRFYTKFNYCVLNYKTGDYKMVS